MKKTPNLRIEKYRQRENPWAPSTMRDGNNGVFFVPSVWNPYLRQRDTLTVIASDGLDGTEWEHVSVSLANRTPTWEEMELVRELFWRDDECVVQFSPPREERINNHAHCLHMWRALTEAMPMPPSILVGVSGIELSAAR